MGEAELHTVSSGLPGAAAAGCAAADRRAGCHWQMQAVEAIRAQLLHGTPPADGGFVLPGLKSQSCTDAGNLQVFVDARSRTSSQASELAVAAGSAASCEQAVAASDGIDSLQFVVGEGSADTADLGGHKITL